MEQSVRGMGIIGELDEREAVSGTNLRLLMQSPFRMFLRAALQKSLKHKTKMRSGAARGGHSRAGK